MQACRLFVPVGRIHWKRGSCGGGKGIERMMRREKIRERGSWRWCCSNPRWWVVIVMQLYVFTMYVMHCNFNTLVSINVERALCFSSGSPLSRTHVHQRSFCFLVIPTNHSFTCRTLYRIQRSGLKKISSISLSSLGLKDEYGLVLLVT